MGYVRKLTGAQGQIDAARQNAAATEAATMQAAKAQQQQLIQSAKAAADAQAQASARAAAEAKASAAVSAPLETVDVSLDAPVAESAAVVKRRKRASFGTGYSTGVSV